MESRLNLPLENPSPSPSQKTGTASSLMADASHPWDVPWIWISSLLLLAIIPRLLWAFADHPRPFSDMEDYYLCAVNYLKGGHLAQDEEHLAYRAPLYPLFIAACWKMFPGNPLLAVRIVQAILGAISAALLYALFQRMLRPLQKENRHILLRHPRIIPFFAALTFSWMADQIFFSSVLLSETLFIFTLLIWANLGVRCGNSCRMDVLFLFSVLVGVMTLIRPVAIFFLPIVAFKSLQAIPRPQWPRRIWLPMFAWTIPIVPWSIRNAIVLKAFVLLTTNSGVNFYLGHNPQFGYYDHGAKEAVRREFLRTNEPNEVLEDRYFLTQGMKFALEHPQALVARTIWKLYFLYLLDKEPWPWEEYNQGEGMRLAGGAQWPLIWWNPFFLLMALAGGAYACMRKIQHGFCLSVVGLYTFSCLIFFARTRFRLPLEPFLLIYVWLGIASLADTAVWGYGKMMKRKG
ncbi:MAG: hypothetical protein AB1656_23935 [Candidatus Omnitrophota bacterium]